MAALERCVRDGCRGRYMAQRDFTPSEGFTVERICQSCGRTHPDDDAQIRARARVELRRKNEGVAQKSHREPHHKRKAG